MKRKRRKKPLLSRLKTKADKALSEYIRLQTKIEFGEKCPMCFDGIIRPIQCAFHFVRRRRLAVRWNPLNLIGACHRCNYLEYRNPDPYRAWFIRKYGVDKYLGLVDESMKPFEPTTEFLEGLIGHFTERLEELNAQLPPTTPSSGTVSDG